jgi:hypothetical protein
MTAGTHQVKVEYYEKFGDASAKFSWVSSADTTAPDTSIITGPSNIVNQGSATFEFSSSEPGSTFECKLDAATFAPCTSPKDYANLSGGSHTFEVRATDASGNTDGTPASQTWSVDATAPTVSGVAPTGGATNVATTANAEATFSEEVDPNTVSASTFTLTKQGATEPLTAQVSYDQAAKKATLDPTADLGAGTTYTATIKGGASGVKDQAGNPLGADETWSFTTAAVSPQDTTPPETTIAIDSGPYGTVKQNNATFAFSSSEANSTFECKLDGATFSACVSPKKYTGLASGSHTFSVRAIDGAKNVDATPASRTWTIRR